jgi:hypothetical protein
MRVGEHGHEAPNVCGGHCELVAGNVSLDERTHVAFVPGEPGFRLARKERVRKATSLPQCFELHPASARDFRIHEWSELQHADSSGKRLRDVSHELGAHLSQQEKAAVRAPGLVDEGTKYWE